MCAIIGYTLVQRAVLVIPGLIVVALLVAFGGFGELLVHHATLFLVDLIVFLALVLHTLLLNPVSHALYMQGQIGGTHFNFSLIAMGLALFTLMACALSLGYVLRLPSQQS
ncbi:hypothetical protein KSB_60160 [Ktedonobacter robiniae]|uniref:Uncharacterized protein n=2 Tax=Ktedonobacter robiniae TaxID=2778365 RepID=A0ABQ3UXW6_9CHLR|nr:hypothetical protein KSB_60160 [Ktedonobacter robiniae]